MNKKIIYLIIFAGLICSASSVLAATATIVPPAGVPTTFPELLLKIAQGVGGLIASLGVIMIIVSGIFYLTSAGSPEKMTKAKTALIYAIIGIVIGIAAEAIVNIIKGIIGANP